MCYQNLHGIWLKEGMPLEVAAAVLNGFVANALVDSQEGKRDIHIRTLEKIPIPEFSATEERRIISLVREYGSLRRRWLAGEIPGDSAQERCAAVLTLIDSAVLSAYRLPLTIERELLQHFEGYERVGPVRKVPQKVRAAELWLQAAMAECRPADMEEDENRWPLRVSEAVYAFGGVAVELIKGFWLSGAMGDERFAGALEELGYVDDLFSHSARRTLLVDQLADSEPTIRYAATQGLMYMEDPAALHALSRASKQEQYPLVKALIDEAIEALRTGEAIG